MISGFACSVEPFDLTAHVDARLLAELAELCCFALTAESVSGDWEISIVLTSDEHMAELHQEFMGLPDTTDIMTFPSDDEPGGDIVISLPQAERQRSEDDWDLDAELRFLVAHGTLHLAGWDDSSPQLRAAMLERQREIISAFLFGR